jgi:hypothetical protein
MITELMHANLFEVFNERDDAHRLAAIARIYADDVRLVQSRDRIAEAAGIPLDGSWRVRV